MSKSIALNTTARRHANIDRYGHSGACCRCGRPTDGSRYVLVGDGFGAIYPPEAEAEIIDSPGFMGLFPIGPDCARRLKLPPSWIIRD